MNTQESKKIAYKVTINTIIVNLLLSLLKFITGIIGNSSAMISDAVHSASDVFSSFIVLFGINTSSKEADKEHPYGHERMECVAAIILATILGITGFGIGYNGFNSIITGSYNVEIPTMLPLIAAVISIVVKEGMYWYTIAAAKKINSGSLKADAWHHRSDALSSVGSFVGILGAILGVHILDPIASIIICLLIFKASFDIFKDALDKMIDKSCGDDTIEKINQLIMKQDGVIKVDDIKTRLFGAKIYIDVEICLDGKLTLYDSHDIAERVHDVLEKEFPEIKHCMVHVNPFMEDITNKT